MRSIQRTWHKAECGARAIPAALLSQLSSRGRRRRGLGRKGSSRIYFPSLREAVEDGNPCPLLLRTARPVWGTKKEPGMMFSNNDEAAINKKLPKELLLRIFSFLDVVTLCRCAQVSRAWNVLALDGSNWQRIDLFDFQRDIEGRVVENISKRCGGFLRKLSLRGCLGVGDNALRTFAQNCRNIEVLNLNGCTKITDTTCTSLSKFCSKLRHLDLASCTSITNLSLKALSEGCPLLEQLIISWCDQVTKDGIQALVRGCGGLRALSLKGCTQLEDEALKFIGAHCPELVTLNLQTCLQITDDGLITICRGCHKLQSLCASGCSNITDAILNALGQNCPRLRQKNRFKLWRESLWSCRRCQEVSLLPQERAVHPKRLQTSPSGP
ncbi:F-box/LRR-repeat protein 20 isoform 5-T7 [Cyanocitta cristata]